MPDQRDEYHRVFDEQNAVFRAQATARMFGQPGEGGGITSASRHTSVYYQGKALETHPELIDDEWIERTVTQPHRIAIKSENETISYWAYIQEADKCIRVILRERDGMLINRFFDGKETREWIRRHSKT